MKTDNAELVTIAKESGLAETKVEGLLSRFGESFSSTKQALEDAKGITVTKEDDVAGMDKARTARLRLKNIRIATENTRKELKEQSLRESKAIDGMANIIKAMIIPAEEHLEKQEKFAENLAQERALRIEAERLNTLLTLTDTPYVYSFKNMEQEVFDTLVAELKTAKAEKEVAEKKAEADRIAAEKEAAAEQERIRQENSKLKAEAEVKEAAFSKERAAAEAKLKAERDAREAAEKIERDRQVEEARKKAELEEKERQALLSPDKDKLVVFANAIQTIKTTRLPAVKSKQAQDVINEIEFKLGELYEFINQKAKEL